MFKFFVRGAHYNRFNQGPQSGPLLSQWKRAVFSRTGASMGALGVGFYYYNLDEAPFTHRRRCIWVPYWLEKKIGDYSYNQIIAQFSGSIIPRQDPVYHRVGGIMDKLLTTAFDNLGEDQRHLAHLKSLDWSIHVVGGSEAPNAFVLPDGKVFIFSSILPICQNDDGLATVLSHELAHQLAHHSSEQMLSLPLYIALSAILYSVTGVSWVNDLLVSGLLRMPASRDMESEADHIGCELMARLCFQPAESVRFWKRMQAVEKLQSGGREGVLLGIFSTHPPTDKRIKDIQSWLPHLEEVRAASGCFDGQFQQFKFNLFGR